MFRARVIPCLLLDNASLVKTVKFKKPSYIGDPANTCRIFNELEVDELAFLDITATRENREPNYGVLAEIADECFMPLSYGGGVRNLEMAERILKLGFEKLILNTITLEKPEFVTALANRIGTQSIVAAIDVRKGYLGSYRTCSHSGKRKHRVSPIELAKELEICGAGEILLTSIDREGTWKGYDVELTRKVADAVGIPVIANGGAGALSDIGAVIGEGNASAAAVGSMVVYQKKGLGVLVNFPDKQLLEKMLNNRVAGEL
jgi:imidazole glycerol-phosphate synthase subunit HisF